MAERPWFRARASGLGWYPITWQGWLATLLGAAIFAAADIALVAHLALRHR